MLDFTKTFLNAIKHYIDSKKLSDFENDLPPVEVPELEKPDWNQNDPEAPDYLKNKPFWSREYTDTLVAKKDVEVLYESGLIETITPLIDGKTYYVTLNDVKYTCVARKDEETGVVYLGNCTIDSYGDGNVGNGEPFYCSSYSSGNIYLNMKEDGIYSFSLSVLEEYVLKIEDKYIPFEKATWDMIGSKFGEVVVVEETVNFDENNRGYIENRNTEIYDLIGHSTCKVKFILDGTEYESLVYYDTDDGDYIIRVEDGDAVVATIYNFYSVKLYTDNFLGDHTLKIVVLCNLNVKIDEKYLPNELARAEDHLEKENPYGYGSLSLNRSSNGEIGEYSIAVGLYPCAIGDRSFATGNNTIARSASQHVIGEYNVESNTTRYVETNTELSSALTYSKSYNFYLSNSYTFDGNTGKFSLVDPITCSGTEVSATIRGMTGDIYVIGDYLAKNETSTLCHVVKGSGNHGYVYNSSVYFYHPTKLSALDTVSLRHKYAHIVGNGTSNTKRSNAHTLDWEGNAWFAGKVFVGGTGQDDPNAVELGAGGSGNELIPEQAIELSIELGLIEPAGNNGYIFTDKNGVIYVI